MRLLPLRVGWDGQSRVEHDGNGLSPHLSRPASWFSIKDVKAPLQAEAHVAFLLGKPPRPGTVFLEVFRLLEGWRVRVGLHLPHEAKGLLPGWVFAADLVVNRGLKPAALAAAWALEEAGIRCCNPVAATAALHDRTAVVRRLEAAGLPVPRSEELLSWPEVVRYAEGRSIVVKAKGGARGRGEGVVLGRAGQVPEGAPFAGPYLVQERIASDGFDRKLYVAGAQVRGLLKRWPPGDGPPQAFTPDPGLVALSRRVGAALGLDIYGVDIVLGPEGPAIVDVNPFPGFRGVAGAAELIADCLMSLLPSR